MTGKGWLWLLIASLVFLILALSIHFARAAEGHTHEGAAGQFYQTWTMPDNRAVSCCHGEDCKSAEAYQKDGQWYARQADDKGDFTPVPRTKEEHERDNPDGRNHLCGRRYGFNNHNFTVFCFIAGSGS